MVMAMRGLLISNSKGRQVLRFFRSHRHAESDLLLFPFTKTHHEHAENGFFRPKPMLLSGLEQEFLVGFGVKDLTIDFQNRSVVQKMKELMPDGMGMKACPFTGFFTSVRSTLHGWLRTTIRMSPQGLSE